MPRRRSAACATRPRATACGVRSTPPSATLADHVIVSAASVVTRSIHKPGQYSGVFPIDDNAAWEKNAATLRHLHALRQRIRALEAFLKTSPGTDTTP